MRPGFCALIASATQHAETSRHWLTWASRPRTPGALTAVARSHVIPLAEMPAIDPWWGCRRGPCAAPRAIARSGLSGKLTRAAGGWKGTRAGLATCPGLRDDSPWRTWQPYGARGRCRLSGAAAGPHCRATRPRAPPPHGLREGLLFAGSVAISVAQTNDVHTGGSNDRFFVWWLLNSFSTVVAQKTQHRIGGSNK